MRFILSLATSQKCDNLLPAKKLQRYLKNIKPFYLDDFQHCMKLLVLADRISYEALALHTKKAIEINEHNFINIALVAVQLNDTYLLDLCKWFAISNP